jgi:YggT family protein
LTPAIALLFQLVLYGLIIAVFGRGLMSFWPNQRGNRVIYYLDRITEPLVGPFRRVIPPIGIFDLSGMVVIILLYIMIAVINRL